MKKHPLLTVAIPTYNRAESLEKIIKQLQQEGETGFVILISDDNSSDNTEIMVKKYQKKILNLRYNKNILNLGYSGNVCKLYELAETKYVWFLCDDDTVLRQAIEKILRAIQLYKPVVAVFNTRWIDSFGIDRIAGVNKDVIYTDIQKLTNYQPLMRTTFLSIVVVEKRISVDTIKEKAYKDNIFFQVTLSLLLLSDKFTYCEIASPIVRRNVGYKYGEFFKFILVDHLNAVYIINHIFDNKKFIEWSKKHLYSALQLYLSQKPGLFNYNGRATKETKKAILKYYKFHCIFICVFVVLYYCIPTVIIKFLYLMRLFTIHGYSKGLIVYRQNINRAFKDTRKTGFTTYR